MKTFNVEDSAIIGYDATSGGMQRKWFMGGYYIKENYFGYEAHAEVLVSEILALSKLVPMKDYVPYELCSITDKDKTFIGCCAREFKDEDEFEITLARTFEKYAISFDKATKKMSTKEKFDFIVNAINSIYKINIAKELSLMLALDALTLNTDRHQNNISFLIKGKEVRLAPIFDNGLSLLANRHDFLDIGDVRKAKAKLVSSDFKKNLSLYEGPAFLDKDKIINYISSKGDLYGRAGKVMLIQLEKEHLQGLFINQKPVIKNSRIFTNN